MSGPDQESWEDDPLVRALRAPGSPDELADESAFVAAFRAKQRQAASVRRLGARLGLSATAAVTTVVLTAGVAAAYNQALPDPVQRLAAVVLGPIGVKGPAPHRHATSLPHVTHPTSPVTLHAHPTSTPTQQPTHRPTPTATPTASPTAPPTSHSSTSPSPTPTKPVTTGTPHRVPASVTISDSGTRVPAGTTVTITGVVTSADGHVLRNRLVSLVAHPYGGHWVAVTSGRTGATGRIVLQSPALDENTGLRLVTVNRVRSPIAHVVVVPVVTATVTQSSGTSTMAISVLGGQPGDAVAIYRRHNGANVLVGTVHLDGGGSAVYSFPTPLHPVRIVLRLPPTRAHAEAQTGVTVAG